MHLTAWVAVQALILIGAIVVGVLALVRTFRR